MTEEEKKAMEILKYTHDKCIEEKGSGRMYLYRVEDLSNAIVTIINLIEKQQKEIENYNKIFENVEETTLYADGKEIHKLIELTDFISKDKIRELKEKVEKEMISNPYDFSYMINQLLGE